MRAVEFSTSIRNGMIEVPEEYRRDLSDHVRVILLADEKKLAGVNLIDLLLQDPIRIRDFHPLTREEIYGR